MYYFIVNPVAGQGRCLKIMNGISERLNSSNIDHEVAYTRAPGHAEELAAQASEDGFRAVIAVGGDGTVKEVATGILRAGAKAALGIIPGGTGNDYRRAVGIPSGIEEALAVALGDHTRTVDAAEVNGKLFLNIASVGFDVAVVEARERFSWLRGLSYYAAVFATLTGYRCRNTRFTMNGETLAKEILLCAVGNGLYYGGGMKVLPESVPDDGSMDVCVINKVSRATILSVFPKFPTGKHASLPYVAFSRTKELTIESGGAPFSVQADGEIIPGLTSATFRILPGVMRVLSPKLG